MNDRINTGGMAFPVPELFNTGMTLRDYFAAKAMNGILSRQNAGYLTDEDIAKQAYMMADAMIKARQGGSE